MKKIICFDVSGTLIDQNSWDIFTSSEEIEKKLKDIFDDYNNNKIPLRDFWDQVALVFKSTGNANIEYIRNHFDDVNVLKEGAEDLINYLKEKGYKIYLISCSINIYLEELTRKLKLDGFFAGTKFIFDENGELLSIESECFENKDFKEEKVRKVAEENNAEIEDIIFVGDGKNDIGAFKITKNGIAIDSEVEELRNIAWKNVKQLKEIKNIL
ncbi:MAG TPA: HAD-IB family phosphatase [Candidatus Pacearchaeota archaeon]|nr:HAD-IB family phosphatase [Candidatus Pacearchaeota archaeon]HOS12606.1 HAD-IB family phosphatase [Candidatus Pacearchaeota archaeon]HPL72804.1 HAD-IB family phosphatase [Candidatus Pacearchaeota archaeon]HRT18049.1 HAD-IB family phosphatase [Candidatus Paceibacterota bacterium]